MTRIRRRQGDEAAAAAQEGDSGGRPRTYSRAMEAEEVKDRDLFLERVFLALTAGCFLLSLFHLSRAEDGHSRSFHFALAAVSLVGCSAVLLMPPSAVAGRGRKKEGVGEEEEEDEWIKVDDSRRRSGGKFAEVVEMIHG